MPGPASSRFTLVILVVLLFDLHFLAAGKKSKGFYVKIQQVVEDARHEQHDEDDDDDCPESIKHNEDSHDHSAKNMMLIQVEHTKAAKDHHEEQHDDHHHCPMDEMAYDLVEHGLKFEPMQPMMEPLMPQMHPEQVVLMEQPKSISKVSGLGEKRRDLQTKFHLKSPKQIIDSSPPLKIDTYYPRQDDTAQPINNKVADVMDNKVKAKGEAEISELDQQQKISHDELVGDNNNNSNIGPADQQVKLDTRQQVNSDSQHSLQGFDSRPTNQVKPIQANGQFMETLGSQRARESLLSAAQIARNLMKAEEPAGRTATVAGNLLIFGLNIGQNTNRTTNDNARRPPPPPTSARTVSVWRTK